MVSAVAVVVEMHVVPSPTAIFGDPVAGIEVSSLGRLHSIVVAVYELLGLPCDDALGAVARLVYAGGFSAPTPAAAIVFKHSSMILPCDDMPHAILAPAECIEDVGDDGDVDRQFGVVDAAAQDL